ncbi:MAG TPA: amidase [Solirubrobacterales bacterium]|nr:amidase [Solirubrobacterales bacterium]
MKKDGAPTVAAPSPDAPDRDTATEADLEPATEVGFLPGDMNRRAFLVRTGGAAAVAGTAAALGPVGSAIAAPPAPRRASASSSSPLPDAKAVLADNRELTDHEVMELAALLQAGEVSAVELAEEYYARINAFNGAFETYGDNGLYNAFVRIDEGIGLGAARLADQRLAAARGGGEAAPYLCGIPMGFKDSIATAGFAAQDGTMDFLGNVALEDATAVGRLRALGVVPLGITIASSYSGTIAGTFSGNAWNTEYIPGGSSQGSGVASAARLAAACLGEETGGSVIFPSACNGDSSIKVSQGLVSVAGLMPLSPGYDTIGPIARSARDAALILNALIAAGPDPFGDPQTLAIPRGYPQLSLSPRITSKPLAGLTIGINKTDWMTVAVEKEGKPTTETKQGVDPQSTYGPAHLAAFERLCNELREMGASVIDFNGVDFLDFSEGANPYYNNPTVLQEVEGAKITPSAAVLNPNRYDFHYTEAAQAFAETRPPAQAENLLKNFGATPAGGGARTFAAAIKQQAGVTEEARREGERRRRLWASNYKAAFDAAGVDFMVVMSVADTPPKRRLSQNYASRRNNQLANSMSFPMVNFPIGFDAVGLPISAQFKGPRFSEPQLVQAMIDYQARHPEWHTAKPENPTPLPTARRLSTAQAQTMDSEDLSLSNDPLVAMENFR